MTKLVAREGQPLAETLANRLRTLITQGTYTTGERLPTEQALVDEYNVSRDTVRRALRQLTNEGLLTATRGRGTYVRAYKPLTWQLSGYEQQSNHTDGSDAWSTEVRRQGRKPSESIEISIEIATERIAEKLQLAAGQDLTVVRKRIRYVDNAPYQLADSYFPEEIAKGTSLMEPRSVSVAGGVLASIGRPQVRIVDEITIRMPTKSESVKLELSAGTPVAEVLRTGYDAEGKGLRAMVTVVPGDRHTLKYEMDAS